MEDRKRSYKHTSFNHDVRLFFCDGEMRWRKRKLSRMRWGRGPIYKRGREGQPRKTPERAFESDDM
jgi:hypothetical protein